MASSPRSNGAQAREGRRPQWVLSGAAFQRLLSSLHADRDRAGQQYEELRHKLIVFFAGRACPEAEDRADETLDRLSRRLQEGEPVRDVGRFAHGVARLVLTESLRRERRRRGALLRAGRESPAWVTPFESETGLDCLRCCAQRLPPADRELILAYYDSMGRERQHERKLLAARLGLTPNALRLRAYRIRRWLEDCSRRCLAGRSASAEAVWRHRR